MELFILYKLPDGRILIKLESSGCEEKKYEWPKQATHFLTDQDLILNDGEIREVTRVETTGVGSPSRFYFDKPYSDDVSSSITSWVFNWYQFEWFRVEHDYKKLVEELRLVDI